MGNVGKVGNQVTPNFPVSHNLKNGKDGKYGNTY